MSEKTILIGVGVIIMSKGKILLGKRKNAHGSGTWGLPGGHLEYGETISECAYRETLEETGLKISNIKQEAFTSDFFDEEEKHYITLFVSSQTWRGIPEVMEPNKCTMWRWFEWDDLPTPLFLSLKNLKQSGHTLAKQS